MKSPRVRPRHPQHVAARATAARRRAAPNTSLGLLQAKARDSTVVRQLLALQRRQAPVLQAVDDDTDAAPEPPAQIPVMVSVEKGKIGSIYFDDGRIRGTHASGPADERGEHAMTERFNIDLGAARAEYGRAVRAKKHGGFSFDEWVSVMLWRSRPRWVLAEVPAAADMAAGPAPANATLFENFGDAEGRYAGYHPSRGAAVKKMLSAVEVGALETAVALSAADTKAPQMNRTFFRSLMENAPALAADMRMPEEIDAEDAEWELKMANRLASKLDELTGEDWSTGPYQDLPKFLRKLTRHSQMIWETADNARNALARTRDATYRSGLDFSVAYHTRAKNAEARAVKACASIEALKPRAGKKIADFHRNHRDAIKHAKDLGDLATADDPLSRLLFED